MKKHFIAYFAFTLIILFCFSLKAEASTPTHISNDITAKTEWTLSESPYILQKSIILSPNTPLIIDSGVQIISNNHVVFDIQGELTSIGNEDSVIVFGEKIDLNIATHSPVIIESADIQGALTIFDGSPQILKSSLNQVTVSSDETSEFNDNNFQNTLLCQNSNPRIINNNFDTPTNSIEATNCQAEITGNTIKSAQNAISLTDSKLVIADNTIWANTAAILLTRSEATIQNNLIQFSDIGIDIQAGSRGDITHNIFTQNGIGISNISELASHINYNDFFLNHLFRSQGDNYAVFSSALVPLDAARNWWNDPAGPKLIKTEKSELISGAININPVLAGFANYPLKKGDIKITEILPNPVIEPRGEWLELYNSLEIPIFIHNLTLCDASGYLTATSACDAKKADFISDLFIPAKSYAVIASDPKTFHGTYPDLKSSIYFPNDGLGRIGNGLNNTGDSVYLFIDSTLLDNVSYPSAQEGKSYALIGANWLWQDSPTPLLANSIPAVIITPSTPKPTQKTDTTCHRINSSDFTHFNGRCVILKGKVTNPSGNTFYLQIGNKLYKIYLQTKYHIKKPRLYKGDTLEVKGLVNLYRGKWRLLPRSIFDIRILRRFVKVKTVNATKTTNNKAVLLKALNKTSVFKSSPKQLATISSSSPNSTNPTETIPTVSLPPPRVKGVTTTTNNKSNSRSKALTYSIISAIILLLVVIIYPRLFNANKNT